MSSSSESDSSSTKSTGTSSTSDNETGPTPYQSVGVDQYLELRQRSNNLIRKRPRLKGRKTSNCENWSYLLENVFTDGETAVKALMEQETNDYRSVVNSIVTVMEKRLLTIGTNMVDIYSMSDRCNCVLMTCVTEFWDEVGEYLTALFNWTEIEIVKILHSKADHTVTKRKAIQDIFDQAQDLLWGIYT